MSEPTSDNDYDAIVIGGGPAGLTAGIYLARARLNSLLIEKGLMGGTVGIVDRFENYPGFPEGIGGLDLAESMHKQAVKFGLKIVAAKVTGLKVEKEKKIVETTEGDFVARAVIIAGGAARRKLGVPGEEEFSGKGVSYCATCDADFFQDVPIALVGGGNSAITEALHLAKFASKVIVIHRRDQLRAGKILQEKAFAEPRIEFRWDSVVERIDGKDLVNRVEIRNVKTGEKSTLDVEGIFVSTGIEPNTDYLKGVVPLDEAGYIITNLDMETEIEGIFATGDIRQKSRRQVITAAGDGATAAIGVTEYFLTYV